MTATLAHGSVLEADGDLQGFFCSSFSILLVLLGLPFSLEKQQNCQKMSLLPPGCRGIIADIGKQNSLVGSIWPRVFDERLSKTQPQ